MYRLMRIQWTYQGVYPVVLQESAIWWRGPKWLSSPLENRPQQPDILPAPQILIVQKAVEENCISQTWILGDMALVKKLTRQCVRCHWAKPCLGCQLMSDLPAMRTTPACLFSLAGLDYARPFYLRMTKVHPGPDGHVCVVTIKMANTQLTRSKARLSLLPMLPLPTDSGS
ncbi:hypothetical protein J437_LFUL004392 [Ladona fulva]|uniref:Uncharacterized protein n=1 Tax=Ladona fulva TaxID=123851 RepID=A0A8K0K1S0_LADFU|nr:hypothetical protein J437_LFUL004392 [Ladona fulva]